MRLSFFLEIWKFPVSFGISIRFELAPVPLSWKATRWRRVVSSQHYTGCKMICHSSSLFLIEYENIRIWFPGKLCTARSEFPLGQFIGRFLEISDFSNQLSIPSEVPKFRFNCNFGMIIRLLDVWIGSVFVFTPIWVYFFQALCNFFSGNKVTAPQVQIKGAHMPMGQFAWFVYSPARKVRNFLS